MYLLLLEKMQKYTFTLMLLRPWMMVLNFTSLAMVLFYLQGEPPPSGDFVESIITLPSRTQIKCPMAQNEATVWDVHFCYNLSNVTLFRFVKFTKRRSIIAPKNAKFDEIHQSEASSQAAVRADLSGFAPNSEQIPLPDSLWRLLRSFWRFEHDPMQLINVFRRFDRL